MVPLKPIRPAAPIRAKYDARLTSLVAEMHRSILHWVAAEWRKNPPRTLAQDESPARALQIAMTKLGRRWMRKFDDLADSLAEYFATATRARCDRALEAMLRQGGMSVRFKMTGPMRDTFEAVRAENVGLIRSIAQQHLSHVETLVMQSVSQGRDLATLTKALEKTYGVTKRRAGLIARDQNNKATASMRAVRERELGVTEAIWMHSGGGREPRESHKAFSGKRFELAEGHDFGDGFGKVLPGQAINCLPGDTLIDVVNGCHEVWRYHYRGDMISLEAGDSTVRSTPNHPFLTDEGWVAAQAINQGDYVWQARLKEFKAGVRNVDQAKVTIEQVFLAIRDAQGTRRCSPVGFNFHGDIPDSEVESVWADPRLIVEWHARAAQRLSKFPLTLTDIVAGQIAATLGKVGHASGASGFGQGSSVLGAGALHAQSQCLGGGAGSDAHPIDPVLNEGSRHAEMVSDGEDGVALMEHLGDSLRADLLEIGDRVDPASEHNPFDNLGSNAEFTCDLRHSHSVGVHGDDLVDRKVDAPWAGGDLAVRSPNAPSAEMLAQLVRVHAEMGSEFFEAGEFRFDRVRVRKKLVSKNASSHVYTLETSTGWYSAGHNNLATKNCRCTWRPIVPGFKP